MGTNPDSTICSKACLGKTLSVDGVYWTVGNGRLVEIMVDCYHFLCVGGRHLVYYSTVDVPYSCTKHILLLLLSQILRMLDSMGLLQYQEMFISQQVNGDLLLECDDRMLE